MQELTKENVLALKGENFSLSEDVVDYVMSRWDDYDDKELIFTEVLEYGCQSGIVGHLIYYSDTTRYFDLHEDEINRLLVRTMSEFGMKSPIELFGRKWDEEDPLCKDAYNKNLLAWFGFEETLREIAAHFGI